MGALLLRRLPGHAAQFLIFFTLMEPGDEFVASRNLYGGSLTQFGLSFKKLGWTCHFVDPTRPENFRQALTPRCKAIFVESLANPGGIVVDLEAVAKIAHEAGIPLVVDNTLATPISAGRSTGVPISSAIRRPSFSAAMAMRWAVWWWNPASSTGRRAIAFPPLPIPSPPITG